MNGTQKIAYHLHVYNLYAKNIKLVIMYMIQHINAFLKILEIVIIPHYVIMSLVINILLDVKNNS